MKAKAELLEAFQQGQEQERRDDDYAYLSGQ